MSLIKGNIELAKELGVHKNTIGKWLSEGLITPKKRIKNTIYYNLDDVLTSTGRTRKK